MTALRAPAPLDTAPLFTPLHAELVALLRSLHVGDGQRPTLAGAWRVHDVVAHLLDGMLRKLAAHRDGHLLAPDGPVAGYADVVALVQRLNATGVAFGARLSARVLVDLVDVAGRWMSDFVASLDPEAPALFPVAWAGETESDNRFDTAREYTEHWHHQMQIREAVGTRGRPEVLLARRFLLPLLETAMRVLPHAYRDTPAPDGTSVVVAVSHDAPGEPPLAWTICREAARWRLYAGAAEPSTARADTGPDAAWRLFFNALPESERAGRFVTSGPQALLAPLWRARSVMV